MSATSTRLVIASSLLFSLIGVTSTSSAQEVEVVIQGDGPQQGTRQQRGDQRGRSRWDAAIDQAAPLNFRGGAVQRREQNAGGFPRVMQNRNDRLVLLDRRHRDAAAVAFLPNDLAPPYAVDFEFRTDTGRGRQPGDVGEGIVLMLQRDRAAHGEPPIGADRGFVADGSGYGVHIDPIANEIVLTDGRRRALATKTGLQIAGQRHRLRVFVQPHQIRVFLDGAPILRMRGPVNTNFGGLGFGAGNGQLGARQFVRDVRIVEGPLSRVVAQPEPAPVVAPQHNGPPHQIFNGSFEDPRIRHRSHQIFQNIPGWTLSTGSGFEIQRDVAGRASHGQQHVELDGDASSGIYQDIRTRPGATYEVSFDFAPRPGTPGRDNRVGVFWDGQQVTVAEGSGQRAQAPNWRTYTFRVQANSNVSRLEFRDLGLSNSVGGYIDNVQLRRVGR